MSTLQNSLRTLSQVLLLAVLTLALTETTQAQSISRSSHLDETFVYNSDFKSAYVAYSVENNTGGVIADAWVQIDGLGTQVVLPSVEDGYYQLGDMAVGEIRTAFFYLTTTITGISHQNVLTFSPTETHSISVFAGDPQGSGTLVGSAATFDFTATRNTIAASANKITLITALTAGPTLEVVVTGLTGNVGGSGKALFSPAVDDAWAADDWELVSTRVEIPSVGLDLVDDLYEVSAALAAVTGMGAPYTATYKFALKSGFPSELSPISWFNSGGNPLKHSTVESGTITRLADLSIAKVVDNDTPNVGETITFTVTVNNVGSAVTGVVVTDFLTDMDGCFDAQVYSPTSPTWDGSAWTVDVPAGTAGSPGSVELTISGEVLCTTLFLNTAEITDTGDVMDIDDTNNGPVVVQVTPVDSGLDIAIHKEIRAIDLDKTSPKYGQITFRLTATNLSQTVGATNVVTNDLLDAALMYVADTGGMGAGVGYGTYDDLGGTWTLSALDAGATKFIDITAKLANPGSPPAEITNTATLDRTSFPQTDSDMGNDSATVTVKVADIRVTKVTFREDGTQVDPSMAAMPNEGETIRFEVTVENLGGSDATGIQVEDILSSLTSLQGPFVQQGPTTGSFVAAPAAAGAMGTWTLDLTAGSSATWGYTAVVTGADPFTNMASLVAMDNGILDPDPTNNMGMVDVAPAMVDIVVGKSVEILDELTGRVKFTLIATNFGPKDATGLVLTDTPDPAFVIDLSTISDPSFDSAAWSIGDLANGAMATVTFEAEVVSLAVLTASPVNAVDFTSVDQFEVELPSTTENPDQGDEHAEVAVPAADILVQKWLTDKDGVAIDPNMVAVGQLISFHIKVTNQGPDEAWNVMIKDELTIFHPDGSSEIISIFDLLDFLNSTVEPGSTFDPWNTPQWVVDHLASGEMAELVINGKLKVAHQFKNKAFLMGLTGAVDYNADNNMDMVLSTPKAVDIAISKEIISINLDKDAAGYGQITYRLTAENLTTFDANGTGGPGNDRLIINDPVLAGFDFVSSTAGMGTAGLGYGAYDDTIGAWGLNILPAGDTKFIDITVTLPTGGTLPAYIDNTATLDPSTIAEFEKNDANDTGTARLLIADIEVQKTVDNSTPYVGQSVTFTITVINHGGSDVTGLEIADVISDDSGLENITASWGGVPTNWTVGDLAAYTRVQATIKADVTGAVEFNNKALLVGLDHGIVDPDASNNMGMAPVWPTEAAPKADLELTKTVSNSYPQVGDEITFTVTVTNTGWATAGVKISDILTDEYGCFEFSLGSVYPSAGMLGSSANGYIWQLNLDENDTEQLVIMGWVRCSTPFTNEAEIIHSGSLEDASSGNDWAGVTVTPSGTLPPTTDALCYLVADNDAEGQPSNDVLTVLYGNASSDVKVAHTGTQMIEAIAFNPWSRKLYAADANRLGIIDVVTGYFTEIGDFGSGWGLDGYGQSRDRGFLDVDGLAFDPYGSDALYGTVRKVGEPDLLIKIDPSTGKAIAGAFGYGQDYVTIQGVYG
ncbi:MAG: putative repeat protein (TIGR01451 family), partial [Rhodothermales bacterium]